LRATSDYNLGKLYPNVAREWHPTKNGQLTPFEVTPGSNKKVWWKCDKGHEWEAVVHSRTSGSGCPYCSGRRVGEDNNLAVKYPEIAKEWHPTKNEELTPDQVTQSSNRRVWWQCNQGHEWIVRIANRTGKGGTGCPYCAGKYPTKDYNLAVKIPNLIKQWHPTKNKDLTPFDVTPGSHKKVWWKCKQGHEWQAQIKSRTNGSGCPYCSGNLPSKENNLMVIYPEIAEKWHPVKNNKITPNDVTSASNKIFWWQCKKEHEWKSSVKSMKNGKQCSFCVGTKVSSDNNLVVTHSILISEWHPTKNRDLKPSDFTAKKREKVWWQCEHGHEWQTTIYNRAIQGSGCPECYNLNRGDIYRSFAVKKRGSLLDHYPEIAKEWNYIKNGDLKPSKVTPKSSIKVWWKCSKGHQWKSIISGRTNGTGCPYCSGKIASPEYNLAIKFPNLVDEWHPTKNKGLEPSNFTPHSGKKVWWVCPKGHEYSARIAGRSNGEGCSYCAGKKVDNSNSLASLFPEISKEWHPNKNGKLTANDVTSRSGKKVWWLCSQGHEYPSRIADRTKGVGCPFCSPKTSRIEIRLLTELEIIFNHVTHREVFDGYECDVFIPKYNLGIEVDGYWHKDRSERDLDKLNYFEKKGIKLIRVRDRRLKEKLDSDISYSENEKHLAVVKRLLAKIIEHENLSNQDHSKVMAYLEKNSLQNQKEYRKRTRFIKTVLPEESLGFLYPEVAKEWDWEKNAPLDPSSFAPYSHRKVSWKCEKGHSWDSVIASRTSGTGCPYCSGNLASEENNLASLYPTLAKQWHPVKNGNLKPTDVTYGSNKRVWWIDEEGREWQARVKHRTDHFRNSNRVH